jgi:hypothetical protein
MGHETKEMPINLRCLTLLVLCHGSSGIENKALRVNHVYMVFRLLLWEAMQLEETEKLHSHPDPGRPRAKEEDAMGCQRLTGCS